MMKRNLIAPAIQNVDNKTFKELLTKSQSNFGNFSFSQFRNVELRAHSNEILVVYVDIETSGFGRSAEILQIAAKCAGADGVTFSVYAYPTRGIQVSASQTTGLHMIGTELFLRDEKVPATNLLDACQKFLSFLQQFRKTVVLVGHNSFKFDFPFIYRALSDFDLLPYFREVVYGLSDTLIIFRSDPQIKERESSLSLSSLAEKYVPMWTSEEAHEALSDCITLESICDVFKCTEENLISSCKPIEEFITDQEQLNKIFLLEMELSPLRGIISVGMRKRLAQNGFSMTILKDTYRQGQEESVRILLGEDNGNGKARVTRSKKILRSLTDYLNVVTSVNRNITEQTDKFALLGLVRNP